MLLVGTLWVAGIVSAHLAGHRTPHGHAFGEAGRLRSLSATLRPAWHAPVGPAAAYWTITFFCLSLLVLLGYGVWRLFQSTGGPGPQDPTRIEGLADREEVKARQGEGFPGPGRGRCVPRSHSPSRAMSAGSSGLPGGSKWMGVRDSTTVLGPPRSGKGLTIVIPAILDDPGPVITTATRADNLTVTMSARSKIGPVAVFDPQGLAAGVPSALRWSPVRGCQRPQTAMIRAAAFTAGTGERVTEGNYWEKTTCRAVLCLLHAAALGGRGADSLYEWSLSAPGAKEAVQILMNHPKAASKWDRALDAIISAEQRARDSIWADGGQHLRRPWPTRTCWRRSALSRQESSTRPVSWPAGHALPAGHGRRARRLRPALVAALIEDLVDAARKLAAVPRANASTRPWPWCSTKPPTTPSPRAGAHVRRGAGPASPR